MLFKTNPYDLIFYGKVGCAGNTKQKDLLKKHNISYDDRDILNTQWSKAELLSFFDGLSNDEVINQSAPQIKRSEIDLAISQEALIEMMLDNPILIKRPLIAIGEAKLCGFDIEKINALLNKKIEEVQDINKCVMKY
ncbi:MAG: ArsC/Spx/MgsR family protein [Campylobacterota bacterium]|nr:ArsC/Spx/MgsR family protein [Campylobacterota bacterium]